MMKHLTFDALSTAASQLGVFEQGGNNRGPQVDRYIERAGLVPPASWCACFVFWCIDEAARRGGVPNPFLRTGFCPYLDEWARHEGILRASPQAGDVFLVYGTRAHHTGFVVSVADNAVGTIEGNTNRGGSPDGYGVFRRIRQPGPHMQFVRWERLIEEDSPTQWALYLNEKKVAALLLRNNRSFAPIRAWAQALGFGLEWEDDHQTFKIGGKLLDTQVVMSSGMAFAPVRDLVELAGLRLTVDGLARRITAHR